MSKYHELKVLGKLWIHRVPDISTYAHTGTADRARLVYSRADEQLYYGTGTRWVKFNSKYDVLPQGTRLLMGSFPLPIGWNIVEGIEDYCVMLTSTEANIGTTGGTWTIVGIVPNGSHDHSGYVGAFVGATLKAGDSDKYGRSATQNHTHAILGTAGVDDGFHFHSFGSAWRPYNVKYCIAQFA